MELTQNMDLINALGEMTLCEKICAMQPWELLKRLESEKLNVDGDMIKLQVRLLAHESQKVYPLFTLPTLRLGFERKWLEDMKAFEDDMKMICRRYQETEKQMIRLAERLAIDDLGEKKVAVATNEIRTRHNINDNHPSGESAIRYRVKCAQLVELWGLKYSGVTGFDAINFINDAKDFRKFSKMCDRVLLDIMPQCFMTDKVKRWYRTQRFYNWESFENKFLDEYTMFPLK